MSNETNIRNACKTFFSSEYKKLQLIDEFTQWSIPVRPDLFGATKNKIFSIEIKSDKDSFARLERQLLGYRHFSTHIYVALDSIHVDKFMKNYGNKDRFHHVGVLSFNKNKIKLEKEPSPLAMPMMYNYLWSQELYLFFSELKGRSKLGKSSAELSSIIEDIFSYKEVKELSKKIFTSRIRGKDIKNLFENIDLEEKQIKFDKILKSLYEDK